MKLSRARPTPKNLMHNMALIVCLKAYLDTNREYTTGCQAGTKGFVNRYLLSSHACGTRMSPEEMRANSQPTAPYRRATEHELGCKLHSVENQRFMQVNEQGQPQQLNFARCRR